MLISSGGHVDVDIVVDVLSIDTDVRLWISFSSENGHLQSG